MRINTKIVSFHSIRQSALVDFLKKHRIDGVSFKTEVYVFDVDHTVINGSTMVLEGENLELIIRLLQVEKKIIFITANVYAESCNGRDFWELCMKKRIEVPILEALRASNSLEKAQYVNIVDRSGRSKTTYNDDGIPTTTEFIHSELPFQYQSKAARALILAFFAVYKNLKFSHLKKTSFYKQVMCIDLPESRDNCSKYFRKIENMTQQTLNLQSEAGIFDPILWDVETEMPIISHHPSMNRKGREVMSFAQNILRNKKIQTPKDVYWAASDDHAKIFSHKKIQTVSQIIDELKPNGKVICCGDSLSDDFLLIPGVVSGYFGKASEMEASNVFVVTNEGGDNVKAKGLSPFINEVLRLEYGKNGPLGVPK